MVGQILMNPLGFERVTQTSYTFVWIYGDIILPILFCLSPLLIITTITIILIIKLHLLNKRRPTRIHANRRRNNVTRVLIAVNIVFIVCTVSWPVSRLLWYAGYKIQSLFVFDNVLFFHIVNSSINFLIYMLFSKQYREVVIQNCKCKCLQTADHGTTMQINNRVLDRGQTIHDLNNTNRKTAL